MTTLIATRTTPTGVLTEKKRISSIDTVRGLVMVLMVLDHVRAFFHYGALSSDPTNLQTTTPALFFTRWITHYCAPTFVLLAGTSIFISSTRKPKKELSWFLLTRGLWLIFLEIVVIRFAFFFNFYFDMTILQVIWVIGASMVCMALLIHLRYRNLLIIGLLIVFGHNLADYFSVPPESWFYVTWGFLRQASHVNVNPDIMFWVAYPLLPWLGIMICGYCLGKLYTDFDPLKRQVLLTTLGIVVIALLILIRAINLYGDPAPWSTQHNGLFTLMSFLNTTKYPVSLQYILMTIGPVFFILSFLERVDLRILNPLIVFGRVPMLYYILHFYLIHGLALLSFMYKTGTSFSKLDFHFNRGFGGLTPEGGYSLGWVYVISIGIVMLLYPICHWYNRYKSTHNHWWLSYL